MDANQLEYAALLLGVIATVHMLFRVYWNRRAQERLQMLLEQQDRAYRLLSEVQRLLEMKRMTATAPQAGSPSSTVHLDVTPEDLAPLIREIEDAAKKLEERDRSYVINALQQDSRFGRVRYALKLLRRSGILNNMDVRLQTSSRRLFA